MAKLEQVRNIIWAPSNADHYNHLHVDVNPKMTGVPPTSNPGMTPSIRAVYDALTVEFGPGAYFVNPPAGTKWTHMGGWNRRYIGTGTTWSQHAWWNALDIGPYYGVAEQQVFYDFLMGIEREEEYMPDYGEKQGVDTVFQTVWQEMIDEGVFSQYTDPDDTPRMEELAAFLSRYTKRVVMDELLKALRGVETGLEPGTEINIKGVIL